MDVNQYLHYVINTLQHILLHKGVNTYLHYVMIDSVNELYYMNEILK